MNEIRKWWIVAAAILCLSPCALATEASMELVSPGTDSDFGAFVGPFTVTVNGTTMKAVCDDFTEDVYPGETWTADVNTFSSLSATRFGNQPAEYDEAAWLTLQLLSSPNAPESGAIQYALWAVFDNSGVKAHLASNGGTSFYNDSSDVDGVTYWLNTAGSQTYTAGEFSSFNIYTPNTSDPMSCSTTPGEKCPPQEVLVPTPEPASLLMLATGVGLLGLLLELRRLRTQAAV